MPRPKRLPVVLIVGVNLLTLAAFAVAAAALTERDERRVVEAVTGRATASRLAISRDRPLRVEPFYDDPTVVTDESLRITRLMVPVYST